jgi:hypothetical protein
MTAQRPPAGESLMNPLAQVKFKEGLASFNVGNLAAAKEFFLELGLEEQGEKNQVFHIIFILKRCITK